MKPTAFLSSSGFLTIDLTWVFTLSSKAIHRCWYWSLMDGSLEVSWFFSCKPAAILATWDFDASASSFTRATKNSGYRENGKKALGWYLHESYSDVSQSTSISVLKIVHKLYVQWMTPQLYLVGKWNFRRNFTVKTFNSPDLLQQLVPERLEPLVWHFDLHDQTNTKWIYLVFETWNKHHMQDQRPCASTLHAFSKSSSPKNPSHRLVYLPGDTVASRTWVSSISLEDNHCFRHSQPKVYTANVQEENLKWKMTRDVFAPSWLGVESISIVLIPPIRERQMNEMAEMNNKTEGNL